MQRERQRERLICCCCLISKIESVSARLIHMLMHTHTHTHTSNNFYEWGNTVYVCVCVCVSSLGTTRKWRAHTQMVFAPLLLLSVCVTCHSVDRRRFVSSEEQSHIAAISASWRAVASCHPTADLELITTPRYRQTTATNVPISKACGAHFSPWNDPNTVQDIQMKVVSGGSSLFNFFTMNIRWPPVGHGHWPTEENY